MMNRVVVIGGLILLGFLFGCGESDTEFTGASVPLYVTDTPGDEFPGVEITLFSVKLCSDPGCAGTVTLYENPAGRSIRLSELDGVLQLLGFPLIPAGTYNRLEVTLDSVALVTDGAGNTHDAYFDPETENLNKPNVVLCPPELPGRCQIRFNGAVQPFAMGRLVVDFVLKDFEIESQPCPGVPDAASWCITEVKMHPLTPADMDDFDNGPDFKITGTVSAVLPTHVLILSGGMEYALFLTGTTKCEINGTEVVGSEACLANLVAGMCVEVETPDDPALGAALEAREIETEESSDCQ
ncbi:MAG TPA: DUF4382 domain-containing protein [Nitrospiria bacterium]